VRILDVINKVDLIKSEKILHNSFDKNSIHVSALKGNGIENLKKKIYEKIIF
jgi:50S ribosomal subunit-associated GTPase HflX